MRDQDGAATRAAATSDVFGESHEALGRGGDDLQEIVNLLQTVCDAQIAAISVRHDDDFHYLVTAGVDPLTNPVELSMCELSMTEPGPFVITDASLDDRTRDLPVVNGELMSLRFYASTPITHPDGTTVGRLCLFDSRPRHLPLLQSQSLSTLADSVSDILDLRLRRTSGSDDTAADRAIRTAAEAANDLRQPLTALSATVEMLDHLRTPGDDHTVDELMAVVRRATDRLGTTLDRVLDLQDRARPPRVVPVVLDRLVTRARASVVAGLPESGAGVEITVDRLPTVLGDPALLFSAVTDLLSNAARFGRPGRPARVHVDALAEEDRWRLRVSDDGIGIPRQMQRVVLEPFVRLTTADGHGLGLTSVARVAEAHGGDLRLEANEDGGTTVSLSLAAVPPRQDGP